MAAYQSSDTKALQDENSRLKLEMSVLRQERDAALNTCRLMQRHYCEVGTSMLTPLQLNIGSNGVPADISVTIPSSSVFSAVEQHQSTVTTRLPSPAGCTDNLTSPSVVRHINRAVLAEDNMKQMSKSNLLPPAEHTASRHAPCTSLSVEGQKNRQPSIKPNIVRPHRFDGRESKAESSGWLGFCPRSGTDAIIISDSIMRCVERRSFGRDVDLWACSGLRTGELVEILYRWYSFGVSTSTLIICVGANDYFRSPLTRRVNIPWADVFKYDLEKIIKLAGHIATKVIISNCFHSRWNRRQKCNSRESFQNLENWNALVAELAKRHQAVVFDLAGMFEDHEGADGQTGPEWYHKDSLHPNARGTVAIETCLNQLLNGKQVKVPLDDDPCFMFNDKEEVERRRSIMQYNYNRFKRHENRKRKR